MHHPVFLLLTATATTPKKLPSSIPFAFCQILIVHQLKLIQNFLKVVIEIIWRRPHENSNRTQPNVAQVHVKELHFGIKSFARNRVFGRDLDIVMVQIGIVGHGRGIARIIGNGRSLSLTLSNAFAGFIDQ